MHRSTHSPHKDSHSHSKNTHSGQESGAHNIFEKNPRDLITLSLSPSQAVFNIRKLDSGAHLIECDGIGLENVAPDAELL